MFKTTLLTLCLITSAAYAQTPAPPAKTDKVPPVTGTNARENDKLDIRKLEQKYWAAKDDDFSVVQNRKYQKAQRFYLSGSYGVPFNDAFSTGSVFNFNGGYFFNERWGVELQYMKGALKDNDSTSQFQSRYGVYPDHNVYTSAMVANLTFVPLYAKMSFMERSIIYFDMGFSLGAGTLSYKIKKQEGDDNKTAPTVQLAVFQQIFFTEHFALRVDLINRWTTESRSKYYYSLPSSVGGGTVTDRDLGSKVINDSSLLVGLTYWF